MRSEAPGLVVLRYIMFTKKDQLTEDNILSKDKLILVGVICSAHGISGDVVIKSFTKVAKDLTQLPILDQDRKAYPLTLIRQRANDEIICRTSFCQTREQAQALKGLCLYCRRSDLPDISADTFYFEDLKGLPLLNQQAEVIGQVVGVFNFGAGDVLEIKFTHLKSTEFLPFDQDHFPVVTKDYLISK